MEQVDQVKEATAYIEDKISVKPRLAIVLGSGLGALADRVKDPVV